MYHEHHLPCLHCHPRSYIRMVQYLIEKCLLLRMSRDDCVEALSVRASIQPIVTLTELKKRDPGEYPLSFVRNLALPYGENCKKRTEASSRPIFKTFREGLLTYKTLRQGLLTHINLYTGCQDSEGNSGSEPDNMLRRKEVSRCLNKERANSDIFAYLEDLF